MFELQSGTSALVERSATSSTGALATFIPTFMEAATGGVSAGQGQVPAILLPVKKRRSPIAETSFPWAVIRLASWRRL
jgi:hypothetical protein